jgi:hypothetical protein
VIWIDQYPIQIKETITQKLWFVREGVKMFSSFFCCVPMVLIAPLCYLEYRGMRYVRETMGYTGFPYVMASLIVYVAPILLALLIIALLAGLLLDGQWAWLGESAPIGRQTEWTSGIMFALMATWPFFIGYGLVGLVIWILAYREMDQEHVVVTS